MLKCDLWREPLDTKNGLKSNNNAYIIGTKGNVLIIFHIENNTFGQSNFRDCAHRHNVYPL